MRIDKQSTRFFFGTILLVLLVAIQRWSMGLVGNAPGGYYRHNSKHKPENPPLLNTPLKPKSADAIVHDLRIADATLSQSNRNITSDASPELPRVYICGFLSFFPSSSSSGPGAVMPLFPNHTYVRLTKQTGPPDLSTVSPNDVMVTSEKPGGCEGVWKDNDAYFDWIPLFPGKVLYRNGESNYRWRGDPPDNMYLAGYYPDSMEHRTVHITWMQMVLMYYGPQWWEKVLRHDKKPVNKNERFLVYAAGNCVPYRTEALQRLGNISPVDCVGRCCNRINNTLWQSPPEGSPLLNIKQHDNREAFSPYRFCLVMENTYVDGYITEKILNAFLAGCIPIWYGTREVYDIFNKDAFIYYDIDDPSRALDRVRSLEANRSAYDEMMNQPILANSEETIKNYFSYTPALGGGELVKKLHRMMGLS